MGDASLPPAVRPGVYRDRWGTLHVVEGAEPGLDARRGAAWVVRCAGWGSHAGHAIESSDFEFVDVLGRPEFEWVGEADASAPPAPSAPEPRATSCPTVAAGEVEAVDHPAHYGGAADPYEAIKVIEAWSLNFHLGNAAKYIARAGRKGDALEDLQKARWYLDREIARREGR